jgi:hypothetical protein
MKAELKPDSWIHTLVDAYNAIGGQAAYVDVYPIVEKLRKARNLSWTTEAKATIRRTVEDHASASANFRGRPVFYSVSGLGTGVWGLLPEYLPPMPTEPLSANSAYQEGIEGIFREYQYLRRSRNPRLIEERKRLDNFKCQACAVKIETGPEKFVIDVHHLNPLSAEKDVVITSVNDLVCLCPNCHRIAHSNSNKPLSIDQVKAVITACPPLHPQLDPKPPTL